MRETITVSLPRPLKMKLEKEVRAGRLNRSGIIREALRQYLARQELRKLREKMLPEAQSRGFFTDEDVFERVS